MPLPRLDNLVSIGKLKTEPPDKVELEGLLQSGARRLADAANATLAIESRFDLAYGAAHALALAALRFHGYRSENRYLVFQVLPDTLGLADKQWRVLDRAHSTRNKFEYAGSNELDTALVEALIRVAQELETLVRARLANPPP